MRCYIKYSKDSTKKLVYPSLNPLSLIFLRLTIRKMWKFL